MGHYLGSPTPQTYPPSPHHLLLPDPLVPSLNMRTPERFRSSFESTGIMSVVQGTRVT